MKARRMAILAGVALLTGIPVTLRAQTSIPIHVTIVMHSEQTARYDTNPVLFEQARTNLYQFARAVDQRGAMFNFQSDWTFLAAVTNYDRVGRPETGGTNIVAWMERDLGFDIDPHNHVDQSVYNYADVAALITVCGAHPTEVVGGFLAYPPASNQWAHFQGPLTGAVSGATWTPGILWGGASAGHRNETNLWFSGVYAPQDATNYFRHQPGNLPLVGGFGGTAVVWSNLNRLVAMRDAGLLCTGTLTTCNIMVNMSDLNPAFLLDFAARLDAATNFPNLRWVGISAITNIWAADYAARPSYLPFAATNDLDSDGLPDGWEITNLCAITTSDGTADADGDGANNAEEFAAGTGPADAEDVFMITDMERPEVVWSSVSGRTYAVEVLVGAGWTSRYTVVAREPATRWTNDVWADASWWRVVVRPP